MDVDIDEAGNNRLMLEIETQVARRRSWSLGHDIEDAIAFEQNRARAQDAIGQDHVRIGEDNHGRSPPICHTSLRPSSGLADAFAERKSDSSASLSSRRSHRSSGAENTITPGLSTGGNLRSLV